MRHVDRKSIEDAMAAPHPVARLSEIGELQGWCVAALRQWSAGPDGQAAVWNALAVRAGPRAARGVLRRFETLIGLLRAHGSRPLRCRPVGCGLVGLEEASFAQFVETSATGPREDAMLRAMVILRPDLASMAVCHAQDLGLSLLRLEPIGGAGGGAEAVAPATPRRLH